MTGSATAGWRRPYARAVGQRIRAYRQALGLSPSELGRRVGKHGWQVNRWESGGHVPSSETVRRLTAALGVELADLMPGAGPLPPPLRWDGQEVGARLAALRRERGLTAVELGRRAGLSNTGVHGLEAGRRTAARYPTLARLAAALGVMPDALLPGLAPPAPAWSPSAPADGADEAATDDAGDGDVLPLLPDPGPAADVPAWVRYGRGRR